ncbi:MAG: TolB family protein [Solirubrobacterales bacterium]
MVVRTDSTPQPEAICAAAFEDDPGDYVNGCAPEQFVGGERPYISGMDWAPDGSFVYTEFWDEGGAAWEGFSDWNPAETFLYRASAEGKEVEELETPGFKVLGSPKVSPDGTRIAFNGCSLVSFKCGVVLTNADGEEGALVAITEGHSKESNVSFSNDGSRLLYEKGVVKSPTREERQYYSVKLDGTGGKQLTEINQYINISTSTESWEVHGTLHEPLAVDPSSDALVFEVGGLGFYSFHESQEKATEANMTRLFEWGEEPAFNPAGTKIAFSSGGYHEKQGIYVMNPDGSGSNLVAPSAFPYGERALQPVYSPDGSEIAYIRGGVIYRVPTSGGRSTLAVDGETSNVRSLAAAITGSDPELAEHLPAIEAAETAYLASISSVFDPIGEALGVVAKMNKWEIEFCIVNLGECARFADDRRLALNARGALFTNRNQFDQSTRGNAFQHGFWTALMIRSTIGEHEEIEDGLLYALHHETKPFSWDARQDIVNDFVGYFWVAKTGLESWEENGEIHFRFQNKLEFCQGLLPKGKNAIFIHGHNPWDWIKEHDYEFGRLLFRKLRSNQAKSTGPHTIVRSNGRTCAEVWPVVS